MRKSSPRTVVTAAAAHARVVAWTAVS
jgi:hypothetical protein